MPSFKDATKWNSLKLSASSEGIASSEELVHFPFTDLKGASLLVSASSKQA